MLYDPARHEQLTERAWDAAWARDAIARTVAATDDAYGGLWPTHPQDDFPGSQPPIGDVYCGAAGIAWALAELLDVAASRLDLTTVALEALAHFRAAPDYGDGEGLPDARRSSLFCGETGIALVAWRLTRDESLAESIAALAEANLSNSANELMWGVPGTLLAARYIGRADIVDRSERALRATRDGDGLWTQRLYGHSFRALGPVHGFVGNVAALGDTAGAAATLACHALRENDHVNWPPAIDDAKLRIQWCHGAPGIVTTAASYLDEELLLGGAQLTWDAGPLESQEKGAGLCHGTAGNGYALLTAFERTQDELWLDRARAFAVHALEQAERLPPRFALLTGGIGAALFAADCLSATPRFPFVDRF